MTSIRLTCAHACLILLVLPSCRFGGMNGTTNNDRNSVQKPAQTNKSPDLIDSGVFDNNRPMLQSWIEFIQDGKYRAANGNDFKFSEAAKEKLRSLFEDGWYARVNHPAITGNIQRLHGFKDLAVIVVDNERNDIDKFGLVIFNTEPDDGKTSVHWLIRDRDLSSAILSWHSNWPVLVFYGEDGSSDPYYVNWNASTKTYFLDKQQVGPDARPGRLHKKEQKSPGQALTVGGHVLLN